jgi:ribonuclease HI
MNKPIVTVHTDGCCIGNPGAGGWAYILECSGKKKESYGGYYHTTNNRMELVALIKAIQALKTSCVLNGVSDSQYVVNGVNNWINKDVFLQGKVNSDLWGVLKCTLTLGGHELKMQWVRGHNGNVDNERCDELANLGAIQSEREEDSVYVESKR